MTLRVVLSVAEILLVVAVLAYFLNRVARQLNSISASLGKITFGVRAVEQQCSVIGPAADRINENLAAVAGDLEVAAAGVERMAP
ncbi:MAG: hypothetical protein ACRD0U_01040 [Acidimicrobiales bacterium]